ncbi:MAG: prolyl oligopeptidase family serine peptidase [Acetobacteraceae bacterium]
MPGGAPKGMTQQRPPQQRPSLADPDDDPLLWLEEVDGVRATEWADAQTAATTARLADARFVADRDALRSLLDRPDNLPVPARRGGALYNYWRDALNPRGLWRRTTPDSYRSPAPAWDLLLDLDALAAAEGEDWVWQGATTLPPRHERALLRLSRGGSDAMVLREFDLPSRSFVPDGFVLPEAKGGAAWLDQDTLLLSTALGGVTTSGYSATVRLWRRGTPWDAEPVLFATGATNMQAWGQYDRLLDRLVFVEKTGFYDANVWLGDRGGPQQRIELPSDAEYSWNRDWLAVSGRTAWDAGGRRLEPDVVAVIQLEAFLAGSRDFTVVFEPAPRRALQEVFWLGERLVLGLLDELRPVFLVLQPGGGWAASELAGLPHTGTAAVWPLDLEPAERDGTLLAAVQDPLTPPSLLLTQPGLATPELLKRHPPGFDAEGLVVTRHEAVSTDGERIPYVQCGPPALTRDAPVHLTAYGGFGISTKPGYRLVAGKLWLERGGTTVTANIRGGGEFGTRWHEAGRRAGKRLSHDDFAAVAADLVRRGVTRPGRIAAEGGSNGGLLIANMLTRYPERFGALFCTIPLIDMRRYSKLLAGASWIAEYGDPDGPEWEFIAPLSAYHVAEPGRPYPPILLATTRRDDRVHPGHARKMAAKLQAMGYDAAFYEPAAGGHGYGKDNAEVASFAALGMTFLRRAIGWDA